MEDAAIPKPKRRWRRLNWWKIGFFFMLFIFEICREIIVLQLDWKATPEVGYEILQDGDRTVATGFWKRTDNKEPMDGVPVSIQCDAKRGTCILVYLHLEGLNVSAPDILDLPARFTRGSIYFVDHKEYCVDGPIQIDLIKKIVRHWHQSNCKNKSKNEYIEYILGGHLDSNFQNKSYDEEHFVPVIFLIKPIFKNRYFNEAIFITFEYFRSSW
ncbi:MAG: hypothetical protein JSR96_05775 [Proteobacteria bacterium]|nr:hypothetical protein [Pseudomonadota bacterium]